MLRSGHRLDYARSLQLLACKLNYCQRSCPETKIVELPVGKVKGKRQTGVAGHEYYSFEGIPFGKPPIGPLRFSPTQPAEPWCGCLDCQEERPRPIQMDDSTGNIFGQEDCLYLNVYIKHFDSGKPLPVLVYIHGGGFRTGGATRTKYGPDFLLREDIVYVQFSYRLGAFGFLSQSCPDLGVPGNAGLHDQLLALRWTKEYISYFNGDPENITLMGTSAGAASVHFMMCLPEACGLFHRAILMSGSMTCPWVHVADPDSFIYRLAYEKGYRGIMLEEPILKFLRSLPAAELVENELFGPTQLLFGHLYPFVPTLEYHNSDKGLLKRPFLELMRDAWSSNMPLLLGGNSFEGLMMCTYFKINNSPIMHQLKTEPTLVLPHEIYQRFPKEDLQERAQLLIRFHYGPRDIHINSLLQTFDLFSYKLFWHGIHRVVISRLAFAQAPTYLYRFDFDSEYNNLMRIKLCGDEIKRGVCHADELGYIFPRPKRKHPMNATECQTMKRMVSILTSFARTGNPNCEEISGKAWEPVSEANPFVALNIGNQLKFGIQPEEEGIQVWNKVYDNDRTILYGE